MLAAVISAIVFVPALIAVLLFAVAWMLKFNPVLLTEFQHLIVPFSIIGGIIMLIPLLIGLVFGLMNLWEKIQNHLNE